MTNRETTTFRGAKPVCAQSLALIVLLVAAPGSWLAVGNAADFTRSASESVEAHQDYPIPIPANTAAGSTISGVLNVTYDFLAVPDVMTVYVGTNQVPAKQIFSSGSTSGSRTVAVSFGPTHERVIRIVVNEGSGLEGTVWSYSGSFSGISVTPPAFTVSGAGVQPGVNDFEIPEHCRLLSLGGSAPLLSGNKLNVNFDERGGANAPWTPLRFFTNVAQALINAHFGSNAPASLANIKVYPVNEFTPTIHRLLQVAANLHETAGNSREWVNDRSYGVGDLVRREGRYYRSTAAGHVGLDPLLSAVWVLDDPGLPHVFRPIFRFDSSDHSIYISEWLEVTNANWSSNVTYLDLGKPSDHHLLANATANAGLGSTPYDYMLRGFPCIIGTKGPTRDPAGANHEVVGSGIPNFNEVSFKTLFSLTRKLRLVKTNRSSLRPQIIDPLFVLGVRTGIGAEAWNPSRFFSYPRDLRIHVTNHMSVRLHNGTADPLYATNMTFSDVTQIAAGSWPPAAGAVEWTSFYPSKHPSFQTLLGEYHVTIPESVYYPPIYSNFAGVSPNGALLSFDSIAPSFSASSFFGSNVYPALELKLVVSNSFTYVAIDEAYNRIVDYVNLTNLTGEIDLGRNLYNTNQFSVVGALGRYYQTNVVPGAVVADPMPEGIRNQIYTSLDLNYLTNSDWRLFAPSENNIHAAITRFRRFVGIDAAPFGNVATQMFAPFSPTMLVEQDLNFEVNDPLVHYMTYQLVRSHKQNQSTNVDLLVGYNVRNLYDPNLLGFVFGLPGTIGSLNENYRPWGGNPAKISAGAGRTAMREHFNMGLKDPGIFFADDWDFPERKFDSIGWIGRVHRGTPWQSVYLKSRVASSEEWTEWEGDQGTHPTNDWKLFNALGAHLGPEPSQPLIGINETNFGAWSAVLADLNHKFNPKPFEVIQLAPELVATNLQSVSDEIQSMHAGILRSQDRGGFSQLGEILSVPELSDGSPLIVRDRNRYDPALSYPSDEEVVYRGIRWSCVASAGAAAGEIPPGNREQLLPGFDSNTFTNRVDPPGGTGFHPFEPGDYIWYTAPSVGNRLYRCTATTVVPPITSGAVNHGWMESPWREAWRNPTAAEMFGMSDALLECIPQQLLGLLSSQSLDLPEVDEFDRNGPLSGVLNLSYDFADVPNSINIYSLNVYLGTNQTPGNRIYSSGGTDGTGNLAIPFGPTTESSVRVVINESGGYADSAWIYSGRFADHEGICAVSEGGPAEEMDDYLIPVPAGVAADEAFSGTLNLNYEFLNIADSMKVYLGAGQSPQNLLFATGQTNGANSVSITFGPTTNRVIRIVMNEGNGLADTLWSYNGSFSEIRPFGGGTNASLAVIEFTQPRFVSAPGDTNLTIYLRRTPVNVPAEVRLAAAGDWPGYAQLDHDYEALPSAITWTAGDPEVKAIDVRLIHPANSSPAALLRVGLSPVSSNAFAGSMATADIIIRRTPEAVSYASPEANDHSLPRMDRLLPARRVLPAGVLAGQPVAVVIHATPPPGTQTYTVEDQLPVGWSASTISDGGVFDAAENKVRFGPFNDAENRSLRYTAGLLGSPAGAIHYAGVMNVDGVNFAIAGDVSTATLSGHPADNDPFDGRVTLSELVAYGAAWRRGDLWSSEPRNIPLDLVTGAAWLWRHGESYRVDTLSTNPNFFWAPWVAVDSPPNPAAPKAVAAGGFQTGRGYVVSLAIIPANGVSGWGLVEQIPSGWTVAEITDGGVYHEETGEIRWGPFIEGRARGLGYTLYMGEHARRGELRGTVSFDGRSVAIGGRRLLARGSWMTATREQANGLQSGGYKIRWLGHPGKTPIVEYTDDFRTWMLVPNNGVQTIGDESELSDPGSLGRAIRFYRIREE